MTEASGVRGRPVFARVQAWWAPWLNSTESTTALGILIGGGLHTDDHATISAEVEPAVRIGAGQEGRDKNDCASKRERSRHAGARARRYPEKLVLPATTPLHHLSTPATQPAWIACRLWQTLGL